MAINLTVPKGTESEGKGQASGRAVNKLPAGVNAMGIPHSQTPSIGNGKKVNSFNQLPSTARVVKSDKSNFMVSMSSFRGAGGAK